MRWWRSSARNSSSAEQEAALQVKGIADAEATTRMAIELMRPNADASTYYWDARNVASAHQLDILDFVATDGTIISSAEWPARAGYKLNWVTKTRKIGPPPERF